MVLIPKSDTLSFFLTRNCGSETNADSRQPPVAFNLASVLLSSLSSLSPHFLLSFRITNSYTRRRLLYGYTAPESSDSKPSFSSPQNETKRNRIINNPLESQIAGGMCVRFPRSPTSVTLRLVSLTSACCRGWFHCLYAAGVRIQQQGVVSSTRNKCLSSGVEPPDSNFTLAGCVFCLVARALLSLLRCYPFYAVIRGSVRVSTLNHDEATRTSVVQLARRVTNSFQTCFI